MNYINFINNNALYVVVFLSFLIIAYKLYLWLRPRHQYHIKQSHKIIEKLKEINSSAQILSYLKKINPYVFEEVILSSLDNCDYKIKRSRSYSGDGGVDGFFWINKNKILIQSKRYSKHINRQHIKYFRNLCEKDNLNGIFCHTGRTGKNTWKEQGNRIEIIIGERLVNLITKEKLSLSFLTGNDYELNN